MVDESIFDLELERLKRELSRRNVKRILIQLPEGLRSEIFRISKALENNEVEVIFSADPCYGACDLAIEDAEKLNADLVVHYGHTQMIDHSFPVLYFEAKALIPIREAVIKALKLIDEYERLGLITTIQHIHQLKETSKILKDREKKVLVGNADEKLYPGQVIGCNYRNAKAISEEVDAYIFIGGGKFHALGAALATSKPVFVADPFSNSAYSVDKEVSRFIRQRYACIEEAKKAKRFGVLLGLKSGQSRLGDALRLVGELKRAGFEAALLSIREVTPHYLSQFQKVDAFINTACPRISLDVDSTRYFDKPVLSISEAYVLLGKIEWEDLCREGWFLS